MQYDTFNWQTGTTLFIADIFLNVCKIMAFKIKLIHLKRCCMSMLLLVVTIITFVSNARTLCAWSLTHSNVHDCQGLEMLDNFYIISIVFRTEFAKIFRCFLDFCLILETINILLCQLHRVHAFDTNVIIKILVFIC